MSAYVTTIANLRAASYSVGANTIRVLGYHSTGDGGGGEFYFDTASMATDDSGIWIKPTTISSGSPGRWKRLFNGSINVKWYGAFGDGANHGTAERDAIKAAILYTESNGGDVYIPAGTYLVSGPIIVRSNTRLYGDGANTVIYNNNIGSPHGNCIHIGVCNEYGDWNGSTGGVVDATLGQFDASPPDYSKITTLNTIVENICVRGRNREEGGLGIWVLNASNIVIRNVWSDKCATPVNVANDAPGASRTAASRNVSIDNVHVISAGKWYDLVFVGEAENVTITNCYSNPLSLSILNEMIVSSAGRMLNISNCHLKASGSNSKIGISIGAYSNGTPANCLVHSNIFNVLDRGVVFFNAQENSLSDCRFINVALGVHTYSAKNVIEGNVFKGGTTSVKIETDANSGVLVGNVGVDRSTLSDSNALLSYWKYANNYNYFNSNVQLNTPLTKRYDPVESFMSPAAFTNTLQKDAVLRYTGGGTVDVYYKLPDSVVEITKLDIRWYANAAGDTVTVSVLSQDLSAGTMNSFTTLYTGATDTSGGAGDRLYISNPNLTNINRGSAVYVKIAINFSTVYSQLRDLTAKTVIAN